MSTSPDSSTCIRPSMTSLPTSPMHASMAASISASIRTAGRGWGARSERPSTKGTCAPRAGRSSAGAREHSFHEVDETRSECSRTPSKTMWRASGAIEGMSRTGPGKNSHRGPPARVYARRRSLIAIVGHSSRGGGQMGARQLSRWFAIVLFGCTCGAAAPATAQEIYGSVLGAIQDTSGARIPGASVALTNRETNLVLTTVTNETGAFTFSNVLPGTYDVKVSLQGFKEFVQQAVPVTAGGISRVDAKLQLGSLSESVTVTSEASLLKTDKADTGAAFTATEVVDLPLPEFRNYQSLLDLVPGSTPSAFQNAEIDTPAMALTTNINGTNRNNNSTRVDGATNQFTWLPHHTLYVAPAETIATVNVTTGSFSANQGLAGGAAVTVITKSGTNQLRGSAFGFYTDQRLRAQTYFAKRNGSPKSPTNHHIDGVTIGGPILRNKLFYFGAFEGQYRNTEGESIYTVPTAKMRQGDFSEAFNSNGTLQLIYDPLTNENERNRLPFANNIIPA